MINLKFLLLMFIGVCTVTHATPICTPNLTAEQAYLAIKNPTPSTTLTTNPTLPNNASPTLPQLININTASEAELTQLDGIGAKKAQDIILYREMIAPFATIDDLDKVKGIGTATVQKNKNRITLR
ncbi:MULTISPECIES: ComEA family DNA-binding protein [unclassified Moraxella]|uniref:ComEA family DNA-binding protein n=1 Tax=unclassified Moraxella TaxID=2685852 RepID=UPI003AF5773A